MQCVGTASNAVSAKRNAKGDASAPTTTNGTNNTSTATTSKSNKKFETSSPKYSSGVLYLSGQTIFENHLNPLLKTCLQSAFPDTTEFRQREQEIAALDQT